MENDCSFQQLKVAFESPLFVKEESRIIKNLYSKNCLLVPIFLSSTYSISKSCRFTLILTMNHPFGLQHNQKADLNSILGFGKGTFWAAPQYYEYNY